MTLTPISKISQGHRRNHCRGRGLPRRSPRARLRAGSRSACVALAEGMDDSPAYAKGKLASELREILAELAKAELSPANLSLLEGVEL
jgi:hypothetical protein